MTSTVRRVVVDPAVDFLQDEAAGGVALLVGTVAALIWANADLAGYDGVWNGTEVGGLSLHDWVNDGLMAIFFFVVGLEIKRELVTGELADRRAAALPAIAAVGGVVLPAAIFFLLTAGTPAADGWAIPAATDIAFAVGVIALLGDRVPAGARLLLLTIAIVDDVIAIAIIALFYSSGLSAAWLAASVVCVAIVVMLRRAGAASPWWYVPVGVALWWCVHESGVHATLAGVVLGLMTPARPVRGREVIRELEHRLHPVSAFVAVPVFALANAGIGLGGGAIGDAFSSALTWAVVAGLVGGKLVGVSAGTWLALRLGIGTLPEGVSRGAVAGVAALAGIGFTVSIFIAGLAYEDAQLVERAKLGIFAGSLVSAGVGVMVLLRVNRRARAG